MILLTVISAILHKVLETVAYCITLCLRFFIFFYRFYFTKLFFPSLQYEVKQNRIFVPPATTSSSDHQQRNWRQTLKSQATTLKTHRRNKIRKDHFNVFLFLFKKQTARSNQILKRPKTTQPNQNTEEKQFNTQAYIPSQELIWNQKFVPTQQLWQSTRPNAAPSPHPHLTTGVWRGLLHASYFFFPSPSYLPLSSTSLFSHCFHCKSPPSSVFAPAFAFFEILALPLLFCFMQPLELGPETCNRCVCSTVCVKRPAGVV